MDNNDNNNNNSLSLKETGIIPDERFTQTKPSSSAETDTTAQIVIKSMPYTALSTTTATASTTTLQTPSKTMSISSATFAKSIPFSIGRQRSQTLPANSILEADDIVPSSSSLDESLYNNSDLASSNSSLDYPSYLSSMTNLSNLTSMDSTSLPALFNNALSSNSTKNFLIEKQNDGYYTLDGRRVHTWSSLVELVHVSHFEKDEFMLRDSFQKATSLISVDNFFQAISTMESVRLDQLWLDKLVNVVRHNMDLTKTETWSDAILSYPKTMAFLQHFLIQDILRKKVRVPNTRRYCVKRK